MKLKKIRTINEDLENEYKKLDSTFAGFYEIVNDPPKGSSFLLRDGNFLNLNDGTHTEFLDSCQEMGVRFTFINGSAQLNTGTNPYDFVERAYVSMPKEVTTEMARSLKKWLDLLKGKVEIHIPSADQFKEYDLRVETVDDVFKKIRRAYTTGTLVEAFNVADYEVGEDAVIEMLEKKYGVPYCNFKALYDVYYITPRGKVIPENQDIMDFLDEYRFGDTTDFPQDDNKFFPEMITNEELDNIFRNRVIQVVSRDWERRGYNNLGYIEVTVPSSREITNEQIKTIETDIGIKKYIERKHTQRKKDDNLKIPGQFIVIKLDDYDDVFSDYSSYESENIDTVVKLLKDYKATGHIERVIKEDFNIVDYEIGEDGVIKDLEKKYGQAQCDFSGAALTVYYVTANGIILPEHVSYKYDYRNPKESHKEYPDLTNEEFVSLFKKKMMFLESKKLVRGNLTPITYIEVRLPAWEELTEEQINIFETDEGIKEFLKNNSRDNPEISIYVPTDSGLYISSGYTFIKSAVKQFRRYRNTGRLFESFKVAEFDVGAVAVIKHLEDTYSTTTCNLDRTSLSSQVFFIMPGGGVIAKDTKIKGMNNDSANLDFILGRARDNSMEKDNPFFPDTTNHELVDVFFKKVLGVISHSYKDINQKIVRQLVFALPNHHNNLTEQQIKMIEGDIGIKRYLSGTKEFPDISKIGIARWDTNITNRIENKEGAMERVVQTLKEYKSTGELKRDVKEDFKIAEKDPSFIEANAELTPLSTYIAEVFFDVPTINVLPYSNIKAWGGLVEDKDRGGEDTLVHAEYGMDSEVFIVSKNKDEAYNEEDFTYSYLVETKEAVERTLTDTIWDQIDDEFLIEAFPPSHHINHDSFNEFIKDYIMGDLADEDIVEIAIEQGIIDEEDDYYTGLREEIINQLEHRFDSWGVEWFLEYQERMGNNGEQEIVEVVQEDYGLLDRESWNKEILNTMTYGDIYSMYEDWDGFTFNGVEYIITPLNEIKLHLPKDGIPLDPETFEESLEETADKDKVYKLLTDEVYYRYEIEGKGTLFQDIDDVIYEIENSEEYVLTDGFLNDDIKQDALEDLETSFNIIEKELSIPNIDFWGDKFGKNIYRSAFSTKGVDKFEYELHAIKYDLEVFGYKLNIFKVSPKTYVYKDEYQIVYTSGDIVQLETLQEEYVDEHKKIYTTTSVTEVSNFLKQVPYSVRVLWDRHLNRYFLCDVYDYTHIGMGSIAADQGYYGNKQSWQMDSYFDDEFGDNAIFYIFTPTGQEKDTYGSNVGEDGYEGKYVYDFGTMTTRTDDAYKESPLAKALGKYNAHYVQDGWVDNYTPNVVQIENHNQSSQGGLLIEKVESGLIDINANDKLKDETYIATIQEEGKKVGWMRYLISYEKVNNEWKRIDIYIINIDVYGDYRNKGYGTKAIKELISKYKEPVYISADNPQAERLYSRLGTKVEYKRAPEDNKGNKYPTYKIEEHLLLESTQEKIGYRNNAISSGVVSLMEIILWEVFEMGNVGILDRFLTYEPFRKELSPEIIDKLEEWFSLPEDEFLENIIEMTETDKEIFVNTLLNALNKATGKNIRYGLWLGSERAIMSFYGPLNDDEEIDLQAYPTSDVVITDMGFDDQGVLYGYESNPYNQRLTEDIGSIEQEVEKVNEAEDLLCRVITDVPTWSAYILPDGRYLELRMVPETDLYPGDNGSLAHRGFEHDTEKHSPQLREIIRKSLRINDGTNPLDRLYPYVELSPSKPTEKQEKSLLKWLDKIWEISDTIEVLTPTNGGDIHSTPYKTYKTKENDFIPDELLGKIKRWYGSGVLVEKDGKR